MVEKSEAPKPPAEGAQPHQPAAEQAGTAPAPSSHKSKPNGCCTWIAVVIALLFIANGIKLPQASPMLPSEMNAAVQTARKHYRLPAIAAAVITSDRIQTAVVGERVRGSGSLATEGDLWHLGSNSKAITATLCALLVAEGRLSPGTPPEQVLPGLAGKVHPGYSGVTLQELLTHRAGLPPYTSGLEYLKVPDFSAAPDPGAEFAVWVLSRKPGGERKFEYSNAGYAIAGAMAAAAGGAPYMELLQGKLLSPLGMQAQQGWPGLHEQQRFGQPWGHAVSWFRLRAQNPRGRYKLESYMCPAGDLCMSIGDYASFVQLHLRGLRELEPDAAGRLPELTAEVVQGLHHAPDGGYAGGWGVRVEGGKVVRSGHEGSAGTFHCITAIEPQRDRAVFTVTNAGGETAGRALRELTEHLLKLPAE